MKKKWLIFILVILFYGKTSLVLAQLAPTPTPTPTPYYYASPTPTPTLKPTATPTPIATQSGAPVTANFIPSLFVFGAGILLIIMGLAVIF